MKILVTGGAGFIGSNIVDRYIEDGYDVVVIDNLSTGKVENVNKNSKFYKVDICDERIKDIFEMENPDIVSHHAAQIDLRKSVEDPIFDSKVNILGSINIIDNCIKYGVKKIIFASSGGAIYGEQNIFPAPEYHDKNPISPYGINKLTIENYLFYFKKVFNLDYIALRYANVYGPRQDPYGEAGVVAIFTQRFLSGEEPIINGDGKQTRDYIYVDDVVEINKLAINSGFIGSVNIGTGVETDVNTIYDTIMDIIGINMERRYGPPKKGEQRRSSLNIEMAKRVFKWSPKVSVKDGLIRTVNYFKNKK
jgi:UDP-glucose 4-epimerase